MQSAIHELKKNKKSNGSYGFNLIVNKSNPKYKEQLKVLCYEQVDFIITSLGSPEETILKAHQAGIKVFCDVTDLNFAKKVERLGADAIIAVNNKAGGHRGNLSPEDFLTQLRNEITIPIYAAGGVGNHEEYQYLINLGYDGVSIGSPFIASIEADVTIEYKNACVEYGKNDIVLTEKISGTPCTVINTSYVKSIGTQQSWIEKILNKNKTFKKWVKMLRFYIGMKATEKAAKEFTYKTVWVAGPSIEHTQKIDSVQNIINRIISKNS